MGLWINIYSCRAFHSMDTNLMALATSNFTFITYILVMEAYIELIFVNIFVHIDAKRDAKIKALTDDLDKKLNLFNKAILKHVNHSTDKYPDDIAYHVDEGCQTDSASLNSPAQPVKSEAIPADNDVDEVPLSDIPPEFRLGVEQ